MFYNLVARAFAVVHMAHIFNFCSCCSKSLTKIGITSFFAYTNNVFELCIYIDCVSTYFTCLFSVN